MSLQPIVVSRLTGLAYVAMLPGGIGFMALRSQLAAETAAGTLANFVQHPDLVRLEIAAAMVIIVAQALAALGFFAFFRQTRPVVGFGIAGFGLINAAAILAGAAATWTALQLVGTDAESAPLVHTLLLFEGSAWKLGGLFFGLWLIPMGIGAATPGLFRAGRILGGILVVGGLFYVLGAFLALSPALAAAGIPDWCAMPATIGELWMMGALLVGARDPCQTPGKGAAMTA